MDILSIPLKDPPLESSILLWWFFFTQQPWAHTGGRLVGDWQRTKGRSAHEGWLVWREARLEDDWAPLTKRQQRAHTALCALPSDVFQFFRTSSGPALCPLLHQFCSACPAPPCCAPHVLLLCRFAWHKCSRRLVCHGGWC